MAVLAAALIVATAIAWGARLISEAVLPKGPSADERVASMLALFAPAVAAVQQDPRALLTWLPIARGARAMFPDAFARIDGAMGSTFPFSRDVLDAAHARWTTEWLGWERAHDAEFKRRAAEAEADTTVPPAVSRGRLDAIEREKLDAYQRRYEEYVRVSKALQSLIASTV